MCFHRNSMGLGVKTEILTKFISFMTLGQVFQNLHASIFHICKTEKIHLIVAL